jgi:hypothetical protein
MLKRKTIRKRLFAQLGELKEEWTSFSRLCDAASITFFVPGNIETSAGLGDLAVVARASGRTTCSNSACYESVWGPSS